MKNHKQKQSVGNDYGSGEVQGGGVKVGKIQKATTALTIKKTGFNTNKFRGHNLKVSQRLG